VLAASISVLAVLAGDAPPIGNVAGAIREQATQQPGSLLQTPSVSP
jgi:hypothetical protein